MLAIDTNLVVRYLTGDDPDQSAKAKAVIESESVFVCTTVLLETEWVLRSVYGYDAVQVVGALRGFAGLEQVTIEDDATTAQALDWMQAGMDFADAVHLLKAADCDAFVSFDRKLARAAKRLGAIPVKTPESLPQISA
jgi:predicted nucleic-acid-binding protein